MSDQNADMPTPPQEPAPAEAVKVLERVDANERDDHQAAKHFARYEWAAAYVAALGGSPRVLDCACGAGFGSRLLLRRGAAEVVGVDNAPEAVEESRRKYGSEHASFLLADALSLTAEQVGTFDAIVCLETLEHVAEPERLLDVFKTLLKPGGLLLVSVPNDAQLGVDNPYHLWSADFDRVLGWMRERWPHVEPYVELHTIGAQVRHVDTLGDEARDMPRPSRIRDADAMSPSRAVGFLYACSAEPAGQVEPVGSQVVNGVDYIHNQQRAIRNIWEESRKLVAQNQDQQRRMKELLEWGRKNRDLADRFDRRIRSLEGELIRVRGGADPPR